MLIGTSQLAKTLLKDEMLFLAGVGLAFSAVSFVASLVCFANFKKGLKPLVMGQVQRQEVNDEFETDYQFQRLNHNVFLVPEQARRFDID